MFQGCTQQSSRGVGPSDRSIFSVFFFGGRRIGHGTRFVRYVIVHTVPPHGTRPARRESTHLPSIFSSQRHPHAPFRGCIMRALASRPAAAVQASHVSTRSSPRAVQPAAPCARTRHVAPPLARCACVARARPGRSRAALSASARRRGVGVHRVPGGDARSGALENARRGAPLRVTRSGPWDADEDEDDEFDAGSDVQYSPWGEVCASHDLSCAKHVQAAACSCGAHARPRCRSLSLWCTTTPCRPPSSSIRRAGAPPTRPSRARVTLGPKPRSACPACA